MILFFGIFQEQCLVQISHFLQHELIRVSIAQHLCNLVLENLLTGVYWGDGDTRNISEPLEGRPTNNRAEIHAAVAAVRQAKAQGFTCVEIRTDSDFLIKSVTKWVRYLTSFLSSRLTLRYNYIFKEGASTKHLLVCVLLNHYPAAVKS